jgi:hypothetical protein
MLFFVFLTDSGVQHVLSLRITLREGTAYYSRTPGSVYLVLCVVLCFLVCFVCLCPVSCMSNVASVFGLSVLDFPFDFFLVSI